VGRKVHGILVKQLTAFADVRQTVVCFEPLSSRVSLGYPVRETYTHRTLNAARAYVYPCSCARPQGTNLTPRRSAETNRLSGSLLQSPTHAHVVFDETAPLPPGALASDAGLPLLPSESQKSASYRGAQLPH